MVIRIIKIILILSGAGILVYEISKSTKDYYLQTIGVILLMVGLFLVNKKIPHKDSNINTENFENEIEDRG